MEPALVKGKCPVGVSKSLFHVKHHSITLRNSGRLWPKGGWHTTTTAGQHPLRVPHCAACHRSPVLACTRGRSTHIGQTIADLHRCRRSHTTRHTPAHLGTRAAAIRLTANTPNSVLVSRAARIDAQYRYRHPKPSGPDLICLTPTDHADGALPTRQQPMWPLGLVFHWLLGR